MPHSKNESVNVIFIVFAKLSPIENAVFAIHLSSIWKGFFSSPQPHHCIFIKYLELSIFAVVFGMWIAITIIYLLLNVYIIFIKCSPFPLIYLGLNSTVSDFKDAVPTYFLFAFTGYIFLILLFLTFINYIIFVIYLWHRDKVWFLI